MNRPLLAVLLLFAAAPAQAQTPGCTYDTCALRLRKRFWSGVSLVQGGDARRVTRLGLFAPHIDLLASGSDSTKAHYLMFRSKQNTGGALLLVGAVFAGVVGGLAYDEAHYNDNKGLVLGFGVASIVFSIWGGSKQVSATDHLAQAIWFYNRDLSR
jgi:hypothetical protein